MPRRPSLFTQSDIARAIRAAKQAGAPEVEIRIGNAAAVVVRLDRPEPPAPESNNPWDE
jgi:hypothetical protein